MAMDRVDGKENIFVGSIFAIQKPHYLAQNNITHILSAMKYKFMNWKDEEAAKYTHMTIDVNDLDDEDLLVHLSKAVRFIDSALYPSESDQKPASAEGDEANPTRNSPGAVYVHCAMGKSRSVSCVVAYLLYKYPHRFGGKRFVPSSEATAQRRKTAAEAVSMAVQWVRQTRPIADPNSGFWRQLELWWVMGCPVNDDRAVENHPIYQKWLYENKLKEARDCGLAPDAEWIRFVDEQSLKESEQVTGEAPKLADRELRCKKCRRVLANSQFVIEHQGMGNTGTPGSPCPHVFIETLSWMRPALEDGALDGRLLCPNNKCGATVGRFAWQGFKCSCGEWVCPAFSLNRGRVDEVDVRASAGLGIRMPPGRGSL